MAKTPDAVLARLTALHPKIIDLTLGRVEHLLERLGRPDLRLPPVVHLAGTNGKGSTQAYLRAGLEAAGYRVHAYISPHLVRFNERIRLAGRLIEDDHLLAVLERCEDANGGEPITYFEITTCAAFLAFAETPADILLLETGLGGRLDATNVLERPAATVITPISLDHQHFLGDTLTAIAGEKAGILKPGVPCIVAAQPPEALAVIEARAAECGAPLLVEDRDWRIEGRENGLTYDGPDGGLELPPPALPGRHQWHNAGAAVTTLGALEDFEIPDRALVAALRDVEWPGRMQRLAAPEAPDLELWLDGGHNPAAAAALVEMLQGLEAEAPKPLTVIVGLLTSKDADGFLAAFRDLPATVLTVPVSGDTAAGAAPQAVAERARGLGLTADVMDGIESALARAGERGGRAVFCGSLYLAGEVLEKFAPPA